MFNLTITPDRDSGLCPVRSVLATVTGKWSSLILLLLADGPLRFAAVRRGIGDVTQRVLTDNLRQLQRDGYLTRRVEAGPPVAVYYALTAQGQGFVDHFAPLVEWAAKNQPIVARARVEFDRAAG